jgi:hypothetical protein
MASERILRIGAVAAFAGALAQLLATVLEPQRSDALEKDIRLIAGSALWTPDRLLDLIGVLLTVGALAIVARTFGEGSGRDWARVGQPFLVLMGALGAVAVLAGANLKEIADSWADATPAERLSYVAAFDAASNWTDALFFGAFMALALYLATLAAAILTGGAYARWIGWAAAVSAALVLAGDLLLLASDWAFAAVLLGFAIFLVVLVALGVALWRPRSVATPNTPLEAFLKSPNARIGMAP